METRANYVLIGAFTLSGLVALLGFVLWFAQVELDRQFAYYDIRFSSVAGLSEASEVRFAGLPVGQVVDVRLAPDRTGEVLVRVEVAAETPVRTSSVATIESLGVTGVSFVGISPGSREDPQLEPGTFGDVPVIPSERSVLETLTDDAPALIEELLATAQQIGEILGPANQERIAAILDNLEQSSGNLGQALDDIAQVTGVVSEAGTQIAEFTGRLESIADAATQTFAEADRTLGDVSDLAVRAQTTLDRGDEALVAATQFLEGGVPALIEDLQQTTDALRTEIRRIGDDAETLVENLQGTGQLASARLVEAEATITAANSALAQLERTLATVETTSQQVDTFLAEDAAPLAADARGLIANADRVVNAAVEIAEVDLPMIFADIRTASERAVEVIDSVGGDLSDAAGRVDGLSEDASAALAEVSDTFARARGTLDRLDTTLDTGDATLGAAQDAFEAADTLLRGEVGTLVTDLRGSLGRLEEAIGQVADDVPEITSALRETADRANSAFGEVESAATALGPPLRSFADEGLPQYTRLARETRDLISSLDRLVRQIERDPARYFFGNSDPVYRR